MTNLYNVSVIKTISYDKLKRNLYILLHSKPFINNGLETSTNFYTPLAIAQREGKYYIYIIIYIKKPLRQRGHRGYVEVCRSLLSVIKTRT